MTFKFFRQPVGTNEEQRPAIVWAGAYFDATGYARRYRIGSPAEAYHTGADLNCNVPVWDADKNAPVYCIGEGIVTAAAKYPVWGNIIVTRHDLEDGHFVYARYAHMNEMLIKAGDRVSEGQQIAKVGNAFNTIPYHLHFDIAPDNDVLNANPADWPKLNLTRLKRTYADPRIWLYTRVRTDEAGTVKRRIAVPKLNIRNYPNSSAVDVGDLFEGQIVEVINTNPIISGGLTWQRLAGEPVERWIATNYTIMIDLT